MREREVLNKERGVRGIVSLCFCTCVCITRVTSERGEREEERERQFFSLYFASNLSWKSSSEDQKKTPKKFPAKNFFSFEFILKNPIFFYQKQIKVRTSFEPILFPFSDSGAEPKFHRHRGRGHRGRQEPGTGATI